MAWLQPDPSGNFHVSFRFGGGKFKRSLRTKSSREANARLSRLEETIRLVQSGRIEIPENADIPVFLLSDGKLDKKPMHTSSLTLSSLFDAYLDSLPQNTLEDSTLCGIAIHRRHLERHLGVMFRIPQMSQDDLQCYVVKRSREKGRRGNNLSPTTIRKEIATFRSVWNWASSAGHVTGNFPSTGLKYPKSSEKPRFQTYGEIENRIRLEALAKTEQAELWDCLFLSQAETDELLAYANDHARHAFIYPMLVMAAHTGARRSELFRSRLSDFEGGFVTIREKKRVRGQQSTRRVPISLKLASVMNDWRHIHPGGSHTFCTLNSQRPLCITRDKSHHHFECTFKGSKWEVVRGWHCLRHSFCSNCAMQVIDQRIIDSWVGHTTESMRRRYRHLFPNQEAEAMRKVFG